MKKIKSVLAATAVVAIVSACGGGSGDGGGGTPITIDSSNVDDVSMKINTALVSSLSSYNDASDYAPSSETGTVKKGAASAGHFSYVTQIKDILNKYQTYVEGKGSYSAMTAYDNPCYSSGTITFDVTATSETSGTITLTFNNCDNGSGTQNGSMSIVVSGSADTTNMSITYNDFSTYYSGGDSETINGSMDATITSSSTTLSISSLSTTRISNDESYSSSITNYTAQVVEGVGESAVSLNATYTDSLLGGTVTIETLETLHIGDYDILPYQGKIRVTSGGDSTTITYNSDATTFTVQTGSNTYTCNGYTQSCS
jgi:hypothetical protein